jgi:hypothetical protein
LSVGDLVNLGVIAALATLSRTLVAITTTAIATIFARGTGFVIVAFVSALALVVAVAAAFAAIVSIASATAASTATASAFAVALATFCAFAILARTVTALTDVLGGFFLSCCLTAK